MLEAEWIHEHVTAQTGCEDGFKKKLEKIQNSSNTFGPSPSWMFSSSMIGIVRPQHLCVADIR